jgi:hypothetical protein
VRRQLVEEGEKGVNDDENRVTLSNELGISEDEMTIELDRHLRHPPAA